jgi:mono/diheme cytochrome c family protein
MLLGIVLVGVWLAPCVQSASLTLHPERAHPLDLAITGELEGLDAGATGYIRAKDLHALPTRDLVVEDEYLPGKRMARIVLLTDLWAALPTRAGMDTLLADCDDGYASVFTKDFIMKSQPFLIVGFDDKTLDAWKELGFAFNAGPYIISVSNRLSPGISDLLDVSHKQPWAVSRIAVVKHDAYFTSLASTKVSPAIDQGREIWINSCYSCHRSPDRKTGGTKSTVPFSVIQSYAHYNRSYLKQYIRDPKKLNPAAKMEPHPHYTDQQLDQLIAFLRALPR